MGNVDANKFTKEHETCLSDSEVYDDGYDDASKSKERECWKFLGWRL